MKFIRDHLASRILIVALVILTTALALAKPQFLTASNLINVARQISITGPIAIGVTLVLLTGGVDLSLGSVAALAGVAAAGFAHPDGFRFGAPLAVGMAVGLFCGLVNGFLVTGIRVAPFIATLGMMTAARGAALVLSGGRPVADLARDFTRIASATIFGLPLPVLIFGAITLFTHIFLGKFRWGRYLYAIGGNEQAAYASGVSVGGTKVLAYSVCGALAGLSGVVLTARTTSGQPNAGVGYELDAIAAAVIGGTSLSGGTGGVGGTVLGAALMGTINNGLDLANVSSYYQQIVKGAIIVAAVGLDRRKQ